jgi:tRNA-dihydrouridine synthase 4
MDFLDTVIGHPQNRLVDWVTIHPRTRHTPSTTPIRTEALEILTEKYSRTLPILLSGDVFDLATLPLKSTSTPDLATLTLKEDPSNTSYSIATQQPKPSTTNLSGFMSARGLLSNPALFAGHSSCPWETLETFMCNVARCPLPLKLVVHHVQEMCAPGMGNDKSSLLNKKERAKLVDFTNMADLIDFLDEKIEEYTGRKGGMRRDL